MIRMPHQMEVVPEYNLEVTYLELMLANGESALPDVARAVSHSLIPREKDTAAPAKALPAELHL